MKIQISSRNLKNSKMFLKYINKIKMIKTWLNKLTNYIYSLNVLKYHKIESIFLWFYPCK